MSARLLEGRPVADAIWHAVAQRAAAFAESAGRSVCLGLVGGADAAAEAYGRQIERQFKRRGLSIEVRATSGPDLLDVVHALSNDAGVDGILLLTPLPSGVEPAEAAMAIDPLKDVDGQHPANLGRLAQRRAAFVPATALGGLRLLQHYAIELRGARVVVVGRSAVVGMPLSLLLVDADATVTVCHSRSGDLGRFTRAADILCVAAGRAGLIGPDDIQPGSVILDFGTNPGPDGSLVGDVRTADVLDTAGAITPVPGGTGPTTVAVLAEQTVRAAELRRGG